MSTKGPPISVKEAIAKKLPLRELLFGDRRFYRQALTVVLPIVLQNTLTNIVSLLDNIMVGRLGTIPMSAVAISNQLLFVFNLCVWGGISGAAIYGAQFYGKGDVDGLRYTLRFKHFVTGFIALLAFLLFFFYGEQLAALFIAEGTGAADRAQTLLLSRGYMRIILIGLIPFGLTQCYAGSLRETGETRVPMIAGMIAMLVNFIFNLLLIFGLLGFPRLGVLGAAIATVISRFVEAGLVIGYARRNISRFRFLRGLYSGFLIPRELVRGMLQKTLPLLLNEGLWSLGQTMLMQAYSTRGLPVVAAINIAGTITMLFFEICLSIGNATAILIGQRLGAERYLEARKTCWRMATLSVGSCLLLGIILFFFAPLIPRVYNVETEIRQMATQFIRVVAIILPANAFTNVSYFTMRAGGQALAIFLFDCVFTWAVLVTSAYYLTRFTLLPILVIYAAVRATEMLKGVIGFFILRSGIWIRNIVGEGTA